MVPVLWESLAGDDSAWAGSGALGRAVLPAVEPEVWAAAVECVKLEKINTRQADTSNGFDHRGTRNNELTLLCKGVLEVRCETSLQSYPE